MYMFGLIEKNNYKKQSGYNRYLDNKSAPHPNISKFGI